MKKVLIGLAVVVALFVVVGLVLSGNYTVESSILINAEPGKIHALVGDLKRWDEWAPWKEQDPSVQVTLGEKSKGVGASQTWTSDDGNGSLTFTAVDDDKGIVYDMTFEAWTSEGSIAYEEIGDATRVTWSMKGNVDTPVIGGYFAMLMPGMIRASFEQGLEKLKSVVEK
ncbi:MAG: SRPBCC family protein [Planctomycetota bacterium]|jgi:hypothetical protein